MVNYFLKLLLISSLSFSSFAFDTSAEIESLNKEFNSYSKYPILVFDKGLISSLLTGAKDNDINTITSYVKSKFHLIVDKSEAETILDYHTVLNNSASALPFRGRKSGEYKFCAVFPSGAKTDHREEVKRILGITNELNPYPENTIEKVMNLLSLKELKLVSLYHELSHCIDETFVPDQYSTESHSIHMAESFAESLAMLFVAKRFDFRNIALRRSILRGLYTKYMGKYIINDEDMIVMHPSAKEMGVIYYLSPTLISINELLQSYSFRSNHFSTEQLSKMALENIRNYSFNSRAFAAIVYYLKNGSDEALTKYHDFSVSAPDLFYPTYLRLRTEALFLDDLDFLLESF
ncbi:hypothetical protein [Halobacteriovorax sp. JY17]|uniref:hypothetical protein n=1 Tax=Halobacteriovorax sp. JY17 TaxID=2014617 RepID=UPI000C4C2472|nr:hypothetical protein [Halobacteriovorax sp. JY17]PIK15530.1 MAG: hypothetical protein CES88_02070 [Halobacteriovorax sp. JY17]